MTKLEFKIKSIIWFYITDLQNEKLQKCDPNQANTNANVKSQ